jgi:aconitate hydratase
VLSGNRNFEARVHQSVRANFLMSPPLVVAFALAGRVNIDLTKEPLGKGKGGEEVYLRDIWPTLEEIGEVLGAATDPETYRKLYSDFAEANPLWNDIPAVTGEVYDWDTQSTYIQEPPYFEKFSMEAGTFCDIRGARPLAIFGDSVTTDHISPAGAIKPKSPAGRYLLLRGVEVQDFNSYGSRRGNHQVMVRGTFANVRLKNLLVPGSEGTWTAHLPDGEEGTIFEVAERYRAEGVPTIVIAGKEYGSGSSRDWAAKGPNLLGVQAAIADSYERIHRSNLLMMGIVPLQFMPGENAESLGLTGREEFSITGLEGGDADEVTVRADDKEFRVRVRLDTPREREYLRHGGILQYVLRRLLGE